MIVCEPMNERGVLHVQQQGKKIWNENIRRRLFGIKKNKLGLFNEDDTSIM